MSLLQKRIPDRIRLTPGHVYGHALSCHLTFSKSYRRSGFCRPLMSAGGANVPPSSCVAVDNGPVYTNSKAPCNRACRAGIGRTECSGRKGLGDRKPSATGASLDRTSRVFSNLSPFRCVNTNIDMGIAGGIAVALSFISCIWLPATLLCCLPWVQKRE